MGRNRLTTVPARKVMHCASPEVVTLAEASDVCGLPPLTILARFYAGQFPGTMTPEGYRVRRVDLDKAAK